MVDLGAHLLALIAPLHVGDRLTGPWVLAGLSTELGLRLSFATTTDPTDRSAPRVHVELVPRPTPGPYAVATKRLQLSYRSPAKAPVAPALGVRLCEAVAERVRDNEDTVLDALARATEPAADGPRVREVSVTQILEPTGSGVAAFDTLSPYVGCLVGCRFCYAQSRLDPLRGMLGLTQAPWGSYVDVRINAAQVLREQLRGRAPRPIKFCPIVADPYQAIEQRYRLTRACLRVLAQADPIPPVLLLTRMASAARQDLDLMASIPTMVVGVSIPTADEAVVRHFEPRAATVADRVALLAAVRARGVTTMAVVQPQLPGSITALADALQGCADSVSIDVLSGEEAATPLFDDPTYAHARTSGWQLDRAQQLAALLRTRDVPVWRGELPPELMPDG